MSAALIWAPKPPGFTPSRTDWSWLVDALRAQGLDEYDAEQEALEVASLLHWAAEAGDAEPLKYALCKRDAVQALDDADRIGGRK